MQSIKTERTFIRWYLAIILVMIPTFAILVWNVPEVQKLTDNIWYDVVSCAVLYFSIKILVFIRSKNNKNQSLLTRASNRNVILKNTIILVIITIFIIGFQAGLKVYSDFWGSLPESYQTAITWSIYLAIFLVICKLIMPSKKSLEKEELLKDLEQTLKSMKDKGIIEYKITMIREKGELKIENGKISSERDLLHFLNHEMKRQD